MTPDNLSRVFVPTLIKREDPMVMMAHIASDAAVVRVPSRRLVALYTLSVAMRCGCCYSLPPLLQARQRFCFGHGLPTIATESERVGAV